VSANVTAIRRILHTLERLDARATEQAAKIAPVVEQPAVVGAAPVNGHANGKAAVVLPLRAAANR
jgi:hypothetical protein